MNKLLEAYKDNEFVTEMITSLDPIPTEDDFALGIYNPAGPFMKIQLRHIPSGKTESIEGNIQHKKEQITHELFVGLLLELHWNDFSGPKRQVKTREEEEEPPPTGMKVFSFGTHVKDPPMIFPDIYPS